MTTALTGFLSKLVSPTWLTGPIFDKELRVSSRRRRNYILRFIYLLLLIVFVVIVWLAAVELQARGASAYQTSRMSVAGMAVISTIVWFQFLALQSIAVIMLSTAISDEIYHRTLGVLMTTPISSFQIVMGKLLSKLLQLILLLAISLPLLAVVRVFGGVPWKYVISSLCITLTAVIFAGSLSLYFSIGNRRAYVVILKTVFTLGFLYGFVPSMGAALLHKVVPMNVLLPVLMLPNPFAAMPFSTIRGLSPGVAGGAPFFSWPLHCAIMLAASALVLSVCVKIVRKVALRQAVGQLDPALKPKRRKKQNQPPQKNAERQLATGPIRRITGPPVLWKETNAPIIEGAGGRNSIIGLIVTIIALLITYAACTKQNCLHEDFTHISYALLFIILGSVVDIAFSATSITSEKESLCWPILLATSIDDWHILFGKAVGVLRRCFPIWLLLAGHVGFFVLIGYIHPIAIVHLAMLVAWIVVFLCGSGLYFSARLRRTTSAVVANFAFALALWAVIPALLGLTTQITHDSGLLEAYASVNPVYQAGVIMQGAGGSYNAQMALTMLRYHWPFGRSGVGFTTLVVCCTMLGYMCLGFLFAWRAKCRFRRNIF
ncbi:MAG: ABC transporter permease subunit [Planctomycetota bacterium]|jgi:ABC-type transport system involved in multi-copper enzyme maturation permease subunit